MPKKNKQRGKAYPDGVCTYTGELCPYRMNFITCPEDCEVGIVYRKSKDE